MYIEIALLAFLCMFYQNSSYKSMFIFQACTLFINDAFSKIEEWEKKRKIKTLVHKMLHWREKKEIDQNGFPQEQSEDRQAFMMEEMSIQGGWQQRLDK